MQVSTIDIKKSRIDTEKENLKKKHKIENVVLIWQDSILQLEGAQRHNQKIAEFK